MIDFRYHLVSLISVFLALAVGIVLGAGPLRDTISDQLTGQVEQLRLEKESLRVELDSVQGSLADQLEFTSATAAQLLDGALPEYRVAVVRLPDADGEAVVALKERLGQAGADVVSDVELGTLWSDPAQSAFRAKAADELATLLALTPTSDDDPDADLAVLTQALAEALRGASEEDPRVIGTVAGEVFAALSGGTDPLVTGEISQPADLVLVVTAPDVEVPADATPDPDATTIRDAWAATTISLATSAPTVVAGYDTLTNDVVPRIRQLGGVTTTDHLAEDVGRIVAVLALADVAGGGEPAAYGFGSGADAVVPAARTLEPPAALQPAPTPEAPTDGATDGATDEESDPAGGTTDEDTDGTSEEAEPTQDAASPSADAAGVQPGRAA